MKLQEIAYFFYGDLSKAMIWLHEGNVAFHGLTPMEMIRMNRQDEVRMFLQSSFESNEVFRG